MKTLLLAFGLALATPPVAHAQDSCAQFNALVARTYNFKTTDKLTRAQAHAREASLDRFWVQVRANKAKFLPCLRQKVAASNADPFFRFDGSNLLVELSPTLESKRAQVAIYTTTPLPLDTINAGRWVSTLTLRGTEGLDVSKAAKRALDDEKVSFTPNNIVPEYADESFSHLEAAFFLWGSQSEARATPALFALTNNPKYPQREAALTILLAQATSQSRAAAQKLTRDGLSPQAVANLDKFLKEPDAATPRTKPQTTRDQFLGAFNDLLAGKSKPFFDLIEAVPDGEHDAAAVLLPQDLPTLYRVRRHFLLGCNRTSLSFYKSFTSIILAVMQKEAPQRPEAAKA